MERQVQHSNNHADAQESPSKEIQGQVEKANSKVRHLHDHVERRERERRDAAEEKEEYEEGGRAAFEESLYGEGGRAAHWKKFVRDTIKKKQKEV